MHVFADMSVLCSQFTKMMERFTFLNLCAKIIQI